MAANLLTLLNQIGRETVDIIKATSAFKDRTGDLRRSIEYEIISNKSGQMRLIFKMLYYGDFLDQGTKYINARKFFNPEIKKQFKLYEGQIKAAIVADMKAYIMEDFGTRLTRKA